MDRVWGLNASTTAPAKPASLEIGYPRSSGLATTPGYWWYHMVTETLRNPIVAAGLTPSSDAMDQLTQAIEVIAKRNNVTGSILPCRLMDTVGVALSGAQTVDGVSAPNGSRVLRNTTTPDVNNGPWVVNTSGAWSRPTDWLNGAIIPDASLVEIGAGNTYANTVYTLDVGGGGSALTVGTSTCHFIDVTASIKAALANYLTIANAASTYLTISAASTTYATKTEIAAFITTTAADAKYLTKTAAAATYATVEDVDACITATQAASTYLSKTDAGTTYLTKTSAAATYFAKTGGAISGSVSVTGNVSATGDVTAYSSDIRLKRNHKLIENALPRLRHMAGWSYDWDLELCAAVGFTPNQPTEEGLFAQRVQEVLPQAVAKAAFGEDYLTVKYDKVVPLLVRALVQQADVVDVLQSKLDAITAQLNFQG